MHNSVNSNCSMNADPRNVCCTCSKNIAESMGEKSVVEILMERDGLTHDEAVELVIECRDAILAAAVGDEDAEYEDEVEAIQDLLGLEPDYLMEILDFKEC